MWIAGRQDNHASAAGCYNTGALISDIEMCSILMPTARLHNVSVVGAAAVVPGGGLGIRLQCWAAVFLLACPSLPLLISFAV